MVKLLQHIAYQRLLCIVGALVLVALLVSFPLAFWGCKDDTKNYEAEIVNIHFATRMGGDTVVLVSDTIRPSSTQLDVTLGYQADVRHLIPVFTLSDRARADCRSGQAYDFSQPFAITVTSEDGHNVRSYVFRVNALDPPPLPPVPQDTVNSEAQLLNLRLKELEVEWEQRGARYSAEVPDKVDLTSLTPLFELSKGAKADYESGTPYDFTDPLIIRVTAEDGLSASTYRISVRHKPKELSPNAEITFFRFVETELKAVFEGSTIICPVEATRDLKKLTPVYRLSKGAQCDLEQAETGDFTKPRRVEVVSEDGSAKSIYTVVVERKYRSVPKLEKISLEGIEREPLEDGGVRRFIVPKGTAVDALIPKVKLGLGSTCNWREGELRDFTEPQRLVVTSEDGNYQRMYSVEVVVGDMDVPKKRGTLTSFGFKDVQCETVIEAGNVYCYVPPDTDLKTLIPTFTIKENPKDQALGWSTGSLWHRIDGKDLEIKNGETEVDFSAPHEVQVWRKWGTFWAGADIGYYTVTVRHKQGADGKAELKNLTFAGVDEKPVLRGLTYSLNVAPSVDRTKMVPTFQLSDGATASIEPGKVYDLSKPLTVRVTSRQGTVQNRYTIQVSAQANNQAEVVSFRFRELAVVPVIRGTSISCFAGSGVDLSALTPEFTLSRGATGSLESGVPLSFSTPVRMKVTSEDRTITRIYTIRVEQRLNYEAELLSFRFRELEDACTIDGSTVRFTIPQGGPLPTALTPVYTLSAGATCDLPMGQPADFTNPVKVMVTSEDKSTSKVYTVIREVPGLVYDFESWDRVGSGSSAYENPRGGWTSSNVGMAVSKEITGRPSEFPVVTKTTDAHSGSYAAEIKTVELGGISGISIAAGALFLGTFDGSVVMNNPLAAPRFGIPWSGARPVLLKGWYKYKPGKKLVNKKGNTVDGTDELSVWAVLYSGAQMNARELDEPQNEGRIIAKAVLTPSAPQGDYTKFSVPFVYKRDLKPGEKLQFSIILSSSARGGKIVNGEAEYIGAVGSVLTVDDLEITLR